MQSWKNILSSARPRGGGRKKKKKNLFFGLTKRALMLCAAGALLVTYTAMIVDPSKAWFMTLVGLMFIPAFLINLALLVWSVARRSNAGIIPLVALVPALFFLGRYFQFSGPEDAEDKDALTVVSYNVGKFTANNMGLDQKACEDSIASYLKKLDADIICLQEYHVPRNTDIRKYMKKVFPGYTASYHIFYNSKVSFGNITLSRHPIAGEKSIEFEGSTNLALYTDIDLDGTRLRIYNCHFESYGLSPFKLVSDIVHRRDKDVREAEDKARKSILKRPKQVELVMSDIEDCPTESVVVGDFNDNPVSYTYHRLIKDKEDTFVKAGKGFGATYRMLWPFIRIDYILYPEQFRAISHKIMKVKYSDHFPTVARISLSEK